MISAGIRHSQPVPILDGSGERDLVTNISRRLLLSIAALSPGMVFIALQEFAVSIAFLILGLFGALGVAAAALALSPQIKNAQIGAGIIKNEYPSLLVPSARSALIDKAPDPMVIRANLHSLMSATTQPAAFLSPDAQIAMVLTRIMARWRKTDVLHVSDDQARELWLIERVMRATPAEAGAMAAFFASPTAVLAMRDSIAVSPSA
ncbi:hypothetical protein [Marivita sp.]|uniref:hypothetical protein n=1 Tax=Marivita sp. TaxID=2003365 RepID=UPI0025C13D3B|nr:hypothetical protein [Marivita sp.]